MRITHCLISCDSNPEYLEFWPVTAKAWLKLGIQPVLFYIATDENAHPEVVAGCPVYVFEPLPDIPIKIQASTLRFWGCHYYPRDIVLPCDIDLIPLSKKFFVDRLCDISDDSYAHLRPHWRRNQLKDGRPYGRITEEQVLRECPTNEINYLTACYHIARGDTMKRVLDCSDSWENFCRKTVPYWYIRPDGVNCIPLDEQKRRMEAHITPNTGDEIYHSLKVAIAQSHGESVKLLPYSSEEFDWICRTKYGGGWRPYDEEKLRSGFYSAIHCRRPYSEHREIIDNLIDMHDSSTPRTD